MSNISALKTAYETQIAKITDTLTAAQATVLLDEFIGMKTAALALSSQSLDSYSIAQRSITRRKIGEMESAANNKQIDLHRLLFGMTAQMYIERPEGLIP